MEIKASRNNIGTRKIRDLAEFADFLVKSSQEIDCNHLIPFLRILCLVHTQKEQQSIPTPITETPPKKTKK